MDYGMRCRECNPPVAVAVAATAAAPLCLSHLLTLSCPATKQGDTVVKAGEECRSFYVVLGAPTELLAVGEVPAVSREASGGTGTGSPARGRGGCRLLAGQYFGEKGLLRQVGVSVKATGFLVWCVWAGGGGEEARRGGGGGFAITRSCRRRPLDLFSSPYNAVMERDVCRCLTAQAASVP